MPARRLKTWGAYDLTEKSVRGVESIMVSDVPVYRRIGHFRVPKNLTFETRLIAKPLL